MCQWHERYIASLDCHSFCFNTIHSAPLTTWGNEIQLCMQRERGGETEKERDRGEKRENENKNDNKRGRMYVRRQ